MGYKFKGALRKSKIIFIIGFMIWIAFSVLLIAPITVSKVEAENNTEIFTLLIDNFGNIGENLGKVFKSDYISSYVKGELISGIIVLFITLVGFIKSIPKNEYSDIEHGSSDWARGGEQYRVLSPEKGIVLAEKNYLPVNKRGNVNVLVVGRFRFW